MTAVAATSSATTLPSEATGTSAVAATTVVPAATSAAVTTAPETTAPVTTAPVTTAPVTTAPVTTAPVTTVPATTAVATLPARVPTPEPPPAIVRPARPGDVIGRIVIPKLGLDEPLLEGVDLTTLDLGPGYWPGSALPGQVGNLVVAGHRVTHTRPFRYLDELEPGDRVVFDVAGGRFEYAMTGHEIVTPDRVDITDPTADPTATLFACHPPGSTQYRYVVRLALVRGG